MGADDDHGAGLFEDGEAFAVDQADVALFEAGHVAIGDGGDVHPVAGDVPEGEAGFARRPAAVAIDDEREHVADERAPEAGAEQPGDLAHGGSHGVRDGGDAADDRRPHLRAWSPDHRLLSSAAGHMSRNMYHWSGYWRIQRSWAAMMAAVMRRMSASSSSVAEASTEKSWRGRRCRAPTGCGEGRQPGGRRRRCGGRCAQGRRGRRRRVRKGDGDSLARAGAVDEDRVRRPPPRSARNNEGPDAWERQDLHPQAFAGGEDGGREPGVGEGFGDDGEGMAAGRGGGGAEVPVAKVDGDDDHPDGRWPIARELREAVINFVRGVDQFAGLERGHSREIDQVAAVVGQRAAGDCAGNRPGR